MRLTQLRRPVAAAASHGLARCASGPVQGLHEALARLRIGGHGAVGEGRRHASVKSQGAYKLRDSSTIPKKLGAKKTGDSYVIPGNIIYKQRGTKWFPGENVGMGRDHTLFSRATGYVKYYKDPAKHPDRQYIGVVFNKEDKLPYPRHAMRRRKLGMTASVIKPPEVLPAISASGIPTMVVRRGEGRKPDPRDERVFKLAKTGYSYQEDNWRLGTLIRTEKRKMGSRRVVLRHRRARILEALAEKKLVRVDKIARRKEALDAQRAARQKKMREYHARRKAATEAQTPAAAAAAPGPPKQTA